MTFVMGNQVRDRVSGLTGIAIAQTLSLGGMIQWQISPEGDGKTMPEGTFIDLAQIEYVGPGLAAMATPAAIFDAKLGDKVKDKVSGFTGTVVETVSYLNGCVNMVVTAVNPKGKETEAPTAVCFNATRLEVITEKVVEPKKSGTGGPSRSASSMRPI